MEKKKGTVESNGNTVRNCHAHAQKKKREEYCRWIFSKHFSTRGPVLSFQSAVTMNVYEARSCDPRVHVFRRYCHGNITSGQRRVYVHRVNTSAASLLSVDRSKDEELFEANGLRVTCPPLLMFIPSNLLHWLDSAAGWHWRRFFSVSYATMTWDDSFTPMNET